LIKHYYNTHASEVIESTLSVDLGPIYGHFEKYLNPGSKILDVGFGSGRDSLHFAEQNFSVVSIDFSREIFNRGKIILNNEVLLVDVRDIRYKNEFDGIWASAVFMHFSEDEILEILEKCAEALKPEGVIYLSFKYGKEALIRHDRFFNDFDEEKFDELFSRQNWFEKQEIWKTQDARKDHPDQQWLNIILKKK
jgi:cyclopropane fatty-acyl-phospholipid synthase-like methyltransferase